MSYQGYTPDVPLTAATMVLICLRATFDIPNLASLVDDGQPFIMVQWAHSTGGAPPEMHGSVHRAPVRQR